MPNDLFTLWKHFWKSNKLHLLSRLNLWRRDTTGRRLVQNSLYCPDLLTARGFLLSLIRSLCVFHLSFLSDWMRCAESRDWLKHIKWKERFESVPSGCVFELRSSVMLPGYLMNSWTKAGPCPWPLTDREIRPAGILCIFQVLFQCFTEPGSLIRAAQLPRPMDLMIISLHVLK